ncbi:PorV/PorQ family protein [bacterium]|nr:PorV/PorQ family protein [bacterium]MBU1754162.1 PorV/PorQ family protein [bacterium]
MFRIFYLIIIFAILSTIPAQASNKYEGAPGAYLRFGAGARDLAMGKAFVAVADDATSVYWNPAGLARIQGAEFTWLFVPLFEDTNYSFFSFVHPTEEFGAFGIGIAALNSGNFEGRNNRAQVTGELTELQRCIILSHGRKISRRLSIGANIKIITEDIASYSDTKIGMDGAMLFDLRDYLSLGLSVQNIVPPRLKLMDKNETFPITVRAGSALKTLNNNLLLSLDVEKLPSQDYKTHLGAEYWLRHRSVALRMGMDNTEITSGVGMDFENYIIDYSLSHQDLGYLNRISFTYCFKTFGARIQVSPKAFSPLGKYNWTTLKIAVKQKDRVKKWDIIIIDKTGTVVKTYEGKGEPPDEITWEGRDENNKVMPDGMYKCMLKVVDIVDNVHKSSQEKVEIITEVPDVVVPMEMGW